jgi:hypothetical protein
MFGIITLTRKYLMQFQFFLMLSGFLSSLIDSFCSVYSMSVEMVACIAIEAISILEKMHSKGYLM